MPFDTWITLSGHGLHDDPVDVRDLVVARVDRVHGPDALRDVAVHVQALLVRLAGGGRQPLRIERAVELHADETVRLGLVDQRHGLRFAGRHVGHLRRVRALAVDQRGRVHVWHQQLARLDTLAAVDRQRVVVARVAHRGHTHREFLHTSEVAGHVHVAIPQAGTSVLPRPSITCAPAGNLGGCRGTHAHDLALVDHHGLAGEEGARVGVEQPHVGEGHAPAGTLTRDFSICGACAASAAVCASLRRECSPAYCSGSQLRKNTKPKNLPWRRPRTEWAACSRP
jgi:hypothetical protein